MPKFTSESWFLTGPTASGKSAVGLEAARRLNAEIVAMDSMTLYRGMDVGTDKPSLAKRAAVPHHLLDVLEPWESASVDLYLRLAERAAFEILASGRRPLFVGGSPLYLKACLRGIFNGPPADPELRQALEAEAARVGTLELHRRLQSVDPAAAARILPGDLRRIVRALEVFHATGRRISDWQREFGRKASPTPPVACIVRPREEQHRRINERVLRMLEAGWVEEVRRLMSTPPDRRPGRSARQAVGYEEIALHLEGRLSRSEMVERIQTRTRQFYKRQMTWFRHIEECVWIETSEAEPDDVLVERVVEFFERGATRTA
jgi:tRNA dimethylallyltransferase